MESSSSDFSDFLEESRPSQPDDARHKHQNEVSPRTKFQRRNAARNPTSQANVSKAPEHDATKVDPGFVELTRFFAH